MKTSKISQKDLIALSAQHKVDMSAALDVASAGIKRIPDMYLGYNIVLCTESFGYVGHCTVMYDEGGTPWLIIGEAKNLTGFGSPTDGVAQLRGGPLSGTETFDWGSVYAPFDSVVCLLPSSAEGWGAGAEKQYGERFEWLAPHTEAELALGERRLTADFGTKITVLKRGFIFVGETKVVFDTSNTAWLHIKDARILLDFGNVTLGELHTGPNKQTKSNFWGDIQLPMEAVAHFVFADSAAWTPTKKEVNEANSRLTCKSGIKIYEM